MKREALELVIHKHVHHIEKPVGQIPGSFAAEDIHELRVEYKKSRAFLRLLQHEHGAGKLKMPDPLKETYQAAGQVRDIQLFLSRIDNLPIFIQRWQKQLFSCKEQLVKCIEHLHFKKIQSAIKKELPHELQPSTIQQFMHEKIAAIHILIMAAEEDKDLHAVRKHLKDILYNKKLFENDLETPFPLQDFASEQVIDDTTTKLGDFNDRCTALDMLQQYDHENLPSTEKNVLLELQNEWQQQKAEQQKQLLQHLLHLHAA